MMSSPTTETGSVQYINQPEALSGFCRSIQDAPWVALDTEFIRDKTYYPRLCLIQIGVPGHTACIDPLGLDDLAPALDILYNRSIVKVLHACSQDLEIFVHLHGKVPAPIFDTQLAAPLLGLPEQIGYGNFVKEMLGLSLDKAQSRTDWCRRPLSSAQLQYAGDDVRYLAEIYPELRRKLADAGRLDWLRGEFEPYERVERYQHDPASIWQRIRGVDKLRPNALAILQALADWRERVARDKDLPRSWILKDDALLDIARLAPARPADLNRIRNLPQKTVYRYGQRIVSLVQEGRQRQPQPRPDSRRRAKPTGQEEALADILHAQLRLLADRHGINSTVLASRKDLLALAQGNNDVAVLHGWRRELAGAELLAMCGGKRIVSIDSGRVMVTEKPGSDLS